MLESKAEAGMVFLCGDSWSVEDQSKEQMAEVGLLITAHANHVRYGATSRQIAPSSEVRLKFAKGVLGAAGAPSCIYYELTTGQFSGTS